MKNIYIHLFCILFSITVFQASGFANTVPLETPQEVVQLQPTASTSVQTAKAKISAEAQVDFDNSDSAEQSPWDFLLQNWGVLALSFVAFLEVGARLTPTEKDNTILKILTTILNAIIPNFRKGGGVF